MKKFFILFFILILAAFVSAADCDIISQVKDGQYCGIDGQWHDQLSNGEECQNNFECSSGNCIEETCSSASVKEEYEKQKSLMEKILGLFGIGEDEDEEDTTTTTTTTTGRKRRKRTEKQGDEYSISKTFSSISPNRLYCFDINELPIPITKICFISKIEASNVKFNVKRQLEKTSTITQPEGLIYQYSTIDVTNLQDSNLEKATIQFRVTKNWLVQNNLKQYRVILQRNKPNWNIHKPSVVAEDDTNLFYNAYTPGFSWFAITSIPVKPAGQYVPPVTQPVTQQICGDGIIDSGEDCETCPDDVSCLDDEECKQGRCIIKKKSKLWYIIPILLLVIILILILLYIFKRQVKVTKKEFKPVYKEIRSSKPLKIKNKFKNIRFREGLKKATLARASRLSTSTISKIEENKEVKELSKRAALRGVNSLIARRTGVKNKYSYEQVFGKALLPVKRALFPSKPAETALKNYIKKALAAKMTKTRIKSILLKKGWKQAQVEHIFKQLKK